VSGKVTITRSPQPDLGRTGSPVTVAALVHRDQAALRCACWRPVSFAVAAATLPDDDGGADQEGAVNPPVAGGGTGGGAGGGGAAGCGVGCGVGCGAPYAGAAARAARIRRSARTADR
jgi:hypothetical protein